MIHVESQYSCLQELKRCSMLYTSLAAAWLTCIGFTSLPCDEILWMPVILVPFIFQFVLGFSQAIFPLCLFTKPTSVSIHGSWLISVCYPSPKNYSLFLHKMSKFSFFILIFFFSLSPSVREQKSAQSDCYFGACFPSCISSLLFSSFLRHCVKFSLSLRICIHA